ncbi:MAG TPA: TIGR00375 family protein [Candidatus Altiarchaeales archaeon]|nr:TIGR00375 family protein [Candidatus Altiarchaeales archaeon]
MKNFDIDFHVHSKYSGGVSDSMTIPNIASQSDLKGLDCVATGDCLHKGWLKHIEANLSDVGGGVYSAGGAECRFIMQTEVEDEKRVHHLILLPSIESAQTLREKIQKHCKNIDADGRPNVRLNGEQIAGLVLEVGGLMGPAHAFTPWTAVYKEYDSLKDCYGEHLDKVSFLELGLSADTNMADRIQELQDISFLSNSDCHSPWPHRLGREFNRLEMEKLSFGEIEKALKRVGGRRISMNVGLNPVEGKYHMTACTRCYMLFKWEDALALRKRCPECGGLIKRGVCQRLEELASWSEPHHPPHRPPYLHILPLAEVISLAIGVKTLTSRKIQDSWKNLVGEFGSEISILLDVDPAEIKKVDVNVGSIIEKFRSGRIYYRPGGGGRYGTPSLTAVKTEYWGRGQKTLKEF